MKTFEMGKFYKSTYDGNVIKIELITKTGWIHFRVIEDPSNTFSDHSRLAAQIESLEHEYIPEKKYDTPLWKVLNDD